MLLIPGEASNLSTVFSEWSRGARLHRETLTGEGRGRKTERQRERQGDSQVPDVVAETD